MRLAYLAAGAGGMYCGSCIHDNTLSAALQRQGLDVALIPLYTPLRTDEDSVSLERVFYGGINVFLEQKSSLFRHLPRGLTRVLDRPDLLRWVTSRWSSATDARDLGALTVSVLQGEDGHQRKELDDLVTWLGREFRPDLVQLPNSMFLGMTRQLQRDLGVPVLCEVAGEEIFLDQLIEPFRSQARRILSERARDVDGFVAPCHFYADAMADYLQVSRDHFHVVPLGLQLQGHDGSPQPARAEGPIRIGFLARICPQKGLHIAAEALEILAERLGHEAIRLEVAGWLGDSDRAYLDGIHQRLQSRGLGELFNVIGEVDRRAKIDFLRGLHVLTVPAPYHEPKGLYVLEALANGVPVVQPRHGAFPEMLEETGGGILVDAAEALPVADAIQALIEDEENRLRLGREGQNNVWQTRSDDIMATRTMDLYRQFTRKDNL